jgi:hypothetical protein
MGESVTHNNIEQILAEADALVKQIDAEVDRDVREKKLVDIESRVQHLKAASARIQEKMASESEKEKMSSYAEGYLEAFEEISKALHDMKKVLT